MNNARHMYTTIGKRYVTTLLATAFIMGLSFQANCQSPKKFLKNKLYEQAFVEGVAKQNKKVKLKKKFTEVIFESYDTVYKRHAASISDKNSDWALSYSKIVRMTKFRAKVTHAGVADQLKNMLHDQTVLDHLAKKFNDENTNDLAVAASFESVDNYLKAFDLYKGIGVRHQQAEPISTLTSRLIHTDYELFIVKVNQKIGDQYIKEAKKLLSEAYKSAAEAAIVLIEKARTHRPLDLEEEELLKLANLIIGDSWVVEAKKLLETRTKKNARLAYELLNRARAKRTLTVEEEGLLKLSEDLGMTRVLVSVKGANPVHNTEELSGLLNKGKATTWVTYYHDGTIGKTFDFKMEVNQQKPKVVLGDVRRQVKQNSKTVEYWETETNASGNPVKVKKTKVVVAMVIILSRSKTSTLAWSIISNDLKDGSAIHSQNSESKVELTNEFVSLESGDIAALPENIESEVDLDSQPFPTDEEMLSRVKQLYVKELMAFVNFQKDHMRNIDAVISK